MPSAPTPGDGGQSLQIERAGWVQVPFYNTVSFTNGGGPQTLAPGSGGQTIVAGQIEVVDGTLTVENAAGITVQGELDVSDDQPLPMDGDTLTQGAVTATIQRVMWQSGSWTGGTAAGQFVVTNPSGGNFSAGDRDHDERRGAHALRRARPRSRWRLADTSNSSKRISPASW
jgi:hypothetical protein